MNDKSVAILDHYELTVLRTMKSRGAVLCETSSGLKILKEYIMPKTRAVLEDRILNGLKESGYQVDSFVRNKEGELLTLDRDMKYYAVRDYYEGRECRGQDTEDLCKGMRTLAGMHKKMRPDSVQIFSEPSEEEEGRLLLEVQPFCFEKDCERHNRELKRVRHFIRQKSRKSDFELYLLRCYDSFLVKAEQTVSLMHQEDFREYNESVRREHQFAHGDFQYHNILFTKDSVAVTHFEKYQFDSGVRDIALCLRKVSEKNGWDPEAGRRILDAYENISPLSTQEKKQLFYRLLYPEKFRKITNFYQNSRKTFIPDKNIEKLERLLVQEEVKERFLEKVFR